MRNDTFTANALKASSLTTEILNNESLSVSSASVGMGDFVCWVAKSNFFDIKGFSNDPLKVDL
jgi:hypothetical protein